MKKILSQSLLTIFSIALASSAFSQELAINSIKSEAIVLSETKNYTAELPYINNVNGKVLKSFYKSFGEKADAKWSKTENGFVVHFNDSNMETNVYFRNNGAIDYTVKYYTEEQLPKEVRHTVKSNFYDYSIKQISEVLKNDAVNYFVKLENKDSIKTIRIVGEEWQVVEEVTKQTSLTTKAKSTF